MEPSSAEREKKPWSARERLIALPVVCFLMAAPALARPPVTESPTPLRPAPAARPRALRPSVRAPAAALSTSARLRDRTEDRFRFGLQGGTFNLSDRPSSESDSVGHTLSFGALVDWSRGYWGIEADGYFGSGNVDRGSANGMPQMDFVSAHGGSLAVKGRLPLRTGAFVFVPKLALGYALAYTEVGREYGDNAQANVSASSRVGAIFVAPGGEIVVSDTVALDADVAFPLHTDTSLTLAGQLGPLTLPSDSSPGNGRYFRLRVGARVRVASWSWLGISYVRRQSGMDYPSAAGADISAAGATQKQWLATFLFEM